ncbi:MAG: translational GTPase TypA [Deltaproteobacteria bacterium]|nr:translational GTPase TypA [Deltaproteobacteria bacterium]
MEIRNIAIIAHVDHGKTTLVDGMLKQTHTFRENQAEMSQTTILDSNDLEREKGITILAKVASVTYKDTKINIIDTPGHADFGGEVERVMNMADGAILLIDAAEGPLPQTTFVLEKALVQNLKIIVVLNKIDRQDARPLEVLKETEELFLKLATDPSHLQFPVLYSISREGKAFTQLPKDLNAPGDLRPLFEEILRAVPPPVAQPKLPFKMLVSNLDSDPYKGTYAIGKVTQGTVQVGQSVTLIDESGPIERGKITAIFTHTGLTRTEISQSTPGDIIAVTGLSKATVGQTIADPTDLTPLPTIKLSEPTIKILVSPNSSPFAGQEGKFYTARQLEERLLREKKANIGLLIEPNPSGAGFIVSGRGELHLAIFIENLRREGYELQVGKPEVIYKEENGQTLEPFEEVTLEVDKGISGVVIEEMGRRSAKMTDMHTDTRDITRLVYETSSRNLLGLRNILLTKTRGQCLFATRFTGYFPQSPAIDQKVRGSLIAFESGMATAYAIESAEQRGEILLTPGTEVYEGMIIGLNNKTENIEVNICKTKNLSNVHNATAEVAVQLKAPLVLTLEQYLDIIGSDELLEVTPKSLRLRKKLLTKLQRVREARSSA